MMRFKFLEIFQYFIFTNNYELYVVISELFIQIDPIFVIFLFVHVYPASTSEHIRHPNFLRLSHF